MAKGRRKDHPAGGRLDPLRCVWVEELDEDDAPTVARLPGPVDLIAFHGVAEQTALEVAGDTANLEGYVTVRMAGVDVRFHFERGLP